MTSETVRKIIIAGVAIAALSFTAACKKPATDEAGSSDATAAASAATDASTVAASASDAAASDASAAMSAAPANQ